MLNNKKALAILSLIISILLWVYVMGEVNPEIRVKASNIEVSFVNTSALAENGLAIVQKEPMTINAIIKGRRAEVNDVKRKGINATVDVSDCKEGRNKTDINVVLPSGISVESMSEEYVNVKAEKLIWKDIPVKIEFSDKESPSREDGKVPWITLVENEYITINGAESSVNKVTALSGHISEKAATEAGNNIMAYLTPVDKSGNRVYGIELAREKTNVELKLLETGSLELNVDCTGLKKGLKTEKVSSTSIKVAGTGDVLKEAKTLYGTADLSGIEKSGKHTVEVKTESLPDGIYALDSDTPVITVTIVPEK